MTIAIVTTSLSLGGITSYLIPFVNYLCLKGHDVTVFYTTVTDNKDALIDQHAKLISYYAPKMKSASSIINFALNGGVSSMLRLRFRKRDSISPVKDVQKLSYLSAKHTQPFEGCFDVAISSAEFFCNYLVNLKVNATKKIAWIHPDLSLLDIDKRLSRKMLNSFDGICVVSNSCYLSFSKIFPEFKQKTYVVENIVDQKEITKKANEAIDDVFFPDSKIKIVTVCRFDNSSKRLDRVIKACKMLKNNKIEFIWNLIGTGPDVDYIKDLANEEGVMDVVNFLGSKANPYPYIAKSDVFVLASQYEGKPIVIDEALALHIPCIVSNYKSAKQQVSNMHGAVLENDDVLFQSAFLSTLTKNNIEIWKRNLSSYEINNSQIEKRIDVLIGE